MRRQARSSHGLALKAHPRMRSYLPRVRERLLSILWLGGRFASVCTSCWLGLPPLYEPTLPDCLLPAGELCLLRLLSFVFIWNSFPLK